MREYGFVLAAMAGLVVIIGCFGYTNYKTTQFTKEYKNEEYLEEAKDDDYKFYYNGEEIEDYNDIDYTNKDMTINDKVKKIYFEDEEQYSPIPFPFFIRL